MASFSGFSCHLISSSHGNLGFTNFSFGSGFRVYDSTWQSTILFMDIDLELPIGEETKLNTDSSRVVDVSDGVDVTDGAEVANIEEDDLKLSIGVDAIGNDACSQDVVNRWAVDFEPRNGLEFDSKEAAYVFYRDYAIAVGFGITIRASRRSKKSGDFIDIKIACSRFRSKLDSTTAADSGSCSKTGCKASIHVKKKQDGKWVVYSFLKEHNHNMCPDEFYSNVKGKSKQLEFRCPKGGLQKALDEEDVRVMLNFFMHMQVENPNFLYAVDFDHEKQLRNVFWFDAKGRHDYSYFSDVVFFDTTYVVNRYRLPLIPIFGVNQHFQLILFGCALIGGQTTSNFVWLMKTWLRAVKGQAPLVVLTDHDKQLEEAIEQVYPNVRHFFCLWHVLSKISLSFSSDSDRYERFLRNFKECINNSWTDEQFEERWQDMVDMYELRHDGLISSLYEARKNWAPTYMKDIIFAGLSATERAGSIASFFDKYIEKETMLKDFIEHYKEFLQHRDEQEAKADLDSRYRQPVSEFSLPFLKQMCTVYTCAIYEKFQAEALAIDACNLQKECDDGTAITYQIDDSAEHQNFVVSWNEVGLDVRCSCRSFEYTGILCRHAIAVLHQSGVSYIPSQYILRRWTNNARVRHIETHIPSIGHDRLHRFNDLCRRAIKLGEEGSMSEETYDTVYEALEVALYHCIAVNNSFESVSEASMLSRNGSQGNEEENQSQKIVKACKKKKIYKKRKEHLEPEERTIGRKGVSHDMVTYDQLVSVPPRIVHCSDPLAVQELLQGQLGFRAPSLSGCFDVQDSFEAIEQSIGTAQYHGIGSRHLDDEDVYR